MGASVRGARARVRGVPKPRTMASSRRSGRDRKAPPAFQVEEDAPKAPPAKKAKAAPKGKGAAALAAPAAAASGKPKEAAAPKAEAKAKGKGKPSPVVAKPSKGEWACFACTFFNAAGAETCEMCGTPKGFGGAAAGHFGDAGGADDPPDVHLEYVEGKSSKFWRLKISGCTTMITYGRIGTAGQTDTKIHNNEEEARKFAAKIQAEKERKGYS